MKTICIIAGLVIAFAAGFVSGWHAKPGGDWFLRFSIDGSGGPREATEVTTTGDIQRNP